MTKEVAHNPDRSGNRHFWYLAESTSHRVVNTQTVHRARPPKRIAACPEPFSTCWRPGSRHRNSAIPSVRWFCLQHQSLYCCSTCVKENSITSHCHGISWEESQRPRYRVHGHMLLGASASTDPEVCHLYARTRKLGDHFNPPSQMKTPPKSLLKSWEPQEKGEMNRQFREASRGLDYRGFAREVQVVAPITCWGVIRGSCQQNKIPSWKHKYFKDRTSHQCIIIASPLQISTTPSSIRPNPCCSTRYSMAN